MSKVDNPRDPALNPPRFRIMTDAEREEIADIEARCKSAFEKALSELAQRARWPDDNAARSAENE